MRVSFDFDGTLGHPFGSDQTGERNDQINKIQKYALSYIKDGHQVFIITKRYGPENKNLGLRYEHLPVYDLAFKLGIDLNNVHFTNRDMKTDKILSLNIDIHFDDDQYECDLISSIGVKVIPVHDPYWEDLVN